MNKIKYYITEQLEVIGENYLDKFDKEEDRTVYTGSCGLAYLYIKLSRTLYNLDPKTSKSYLDKAGNILAMVTCRGNSWLYPPHLIIRRVQLQFQARGKLKYNTSPTLWSETMDTWARFWKMYPYHELAHDHSPLTPPSDDLL